MVGRRSTAVTRPAALSPSRLSARTIRKLSRRHYSDPQMVLEEPEGVWEARRSGRAEVAPGQHAEPEQVELDEAHARARRLADSLGKMSPTFAGESRRKIDRATFLLSEVAVLLLDAYEESLL